ncbi:PREDICTED: ribonuclease S-4-like [Ipomoea nil]|uniref:ribonuclease S-4-like n=1 Tax=Ipomoea nil TaxID=35883 RepID=UPI00090142FC|nr:PREDICTED: ribonuclease S-4-like [Ipomoea nil]
MLQALMTLCLLGTPVYAFQTAIDANPQAPPPPPPTPTLTGLKFALTWPNGYCQTKACIPNKIVQHFTIHGLWPHDQSWTSLPPVKGLPPLNDKIIDAKLRSQLVKDWPGLEQQDDSLFWAHERTKHGGFLDQNAYLRKGLALHGAHNLKTILATAKVVPGAKPQPAATIRNALKTALGNKDIILICLNTYLIEIRICYDQLGMNIVRCNTSEDKCIGNIIYL